MTLLSCLSRRVLLGSLVLALLSAGAAPVRADENAEARAQFERGNRLLTRGLRAHGARKDRLLAQAFDAYLASLHIARSRNVVFNAAVALEEMHRLQDAFAYLQEYLAIEDLSEEDRREGTRRMQSLRQRVAVVSLVSDPPGAEVRVDRSELGPRGVTPLEVAVSTGAHRFFLSLHGFDPAELSLTAQAGQRAELHATLEAQPVPVVVQAPATGALTLDGRPIATGTQISVAPGRHTIRYGPSTVREIVVRPGEPQRIDLDIQETVEGVGTLVLSAGVSATVSVDGTVVGEGEEVVVELAGGRRSVRVEASGYAPVESEVDVHTGATVHLEVTMRPISEGTTLGALPIVAWAVTGMAAVAGTLLGVRAVRLKKDYDQTPSRSRLDDTRHANTAADVALFTAVGLGVTALVLTLLDHDVAQEPSTIRIAATPLPGGGVVVATLPLGAW